MRKWVQLLHFWLILDSGNGHWLLFCLKLEVGKLGEESQTLVQKYINFTSQQLILVYHVLSSLHTYSSYLLLQKRVHIHYLHTFSRLSTRVIQDRTQHSLKKVMFPKLWVYLDFDTDFSLFRSSYPGIILRLFLRVFFHFIQIYWMKW